MWGHHAPQPWIYFNFNLASVGSVKWLVHAYRDFFVQTAYLQAVWMCIQIYSYGSLVLVGMECNSLHHSTGCAAECVVMLRLGVNIINDCCSSIQAIAQLSCGPQVSIWGVCSNHPNPPPLVQAWCLIKVWIILFKFTVCPWAAAGLILCVMGDRACGPIVHIFTYVMHFRE